MDHPIQWADRPCERCSRKIGCPHSIYAEGQIVAPAWLQSMYIQKQCKMHLSREEE